MTSRNKLLSSLSKSDFGLLEPHLAPVTLSLRKVLEKPNKRIDVAYFLERGFASVVAVQGKGNKEVEVGLIGREGMTGMPIVLGDHRTPHSTYIQAAGYGQCIRATDLRQAIWSSRSLQDTFLKFVQAFGVQTAHTAICNARSHIDQRLARWLLMAHDRLETECLPLTDEFLSLMLAVRRAGVTEAIHALEVRGLISRTRGRITMRNRRGVEALAGEAYGTPEAEYRRLMG
jgi:CRP-like cAMP-binding protein